MTERPCYATRQYAEVQKHRTLEEARRAAPRINFLGWIDDWQLFRAHNPHTTIREPLQ